MSQAVHNNKNAIPEPIGDFISIDGEDFCAIYNVDQMPPFFISLISASDHWLFISSNGGLTAGRVSPDTPLFPYTTVDKIQDSTTHTGSKTLIRVSNNQQTWVWEPFNQGLDGYYDVSRNLFKSALGDKLRFEEINHDLGLCFRLTWQTSEAYGFIRTSEIENLEAEPRIINIVDGIQNLLPAGTPAFSQLNTSNLVDAYKWSELDTVSGLALYTLYSGITDRAEPAESLRATTVFSLGLEGCHTLISSEQLKTFRLGSDPETEAHKRGIRGCYFLSTALNLDAKESRDWQIIADVEQDQAAVVALRHELKAKGELQQRVTKSIASNNDKLARILGRADGFQSVDEENVAKHHTANVTFNVLRGGIFANQYNIDKDDLLHTLKLFNRAIYSRHQATLENLPETLTIQELADFADESADPQLQRLCLEYLPIMFGRRHGDPSRPWNFFEIKLKHDDGRDLLSYQGNWRDIFQNWEALVLSHPSYIEHMIAKFVNASTMDGHNPYRITKEGIDWEIEDPDDPWSYIGYWGDHQIIYLLKLLELSRDHHPGRLSELLTTPIFSYAHVPYRIHTFEEMRQDPKSTISYDFALADIIGARVAAVGADGKSVHNAADDVYLVNLTEKLLVPLLAKLCNLVIDGGIWLNTQRPEWNDANNALVGHGLSMVTLCYMRRYIEFLQLLLQDNLNSVELTTEVTEWLSETTSALAATRQEVSDAKTTPAQRLASITRLGEAATRYRGKIYDHSGNFSKTIQQTRPILDLFAEALALIDHSITHNRRESGLYEAYNLMRVDAEGAHVEALYAMLEGQVAALSSGGIDIDTVPDIIDRLFNSQLYRGDQESFMLYPDRPLPNFLEKNVIPRSDVEQLPWLLELLEAGNNQLIYQDADGDCRFNAAFANAGDLTARLDEVAELHPDEVAANREALLELYEKVFNHLAFTGRSGGMFGFEGLGSIYWHMVAKLLLAVQENFFRAIEDNAPTATTSRLGTLYYQVRHGLGFNKSPEQYGAFPTDPYSHSPKHAGAQQPGMTGQVKEELLTRFGELGIRVNEGGIHFMPRLLRRAEFLRAPGSLKYLDVNNIWQKLSLDINHLAFTWCQVPIVYRLTDTGTNRMTVVYADDHASVTDGLTLTAADSTHIFNRDGAITRIEVDLSSKDIYPER